MKIAVAMSGGVDSTVAAHLLQKEGHRVIGITAQIFSGDGIEVIEKSRSAAKFLGIEHYPLDLTSEFEKGIINNFCDEYLSGRTPSPCIRCNRFIKFGPILDLAMDLDCDMFATGHYASVGEYNGRFFISGATDPAKDQSYFLFSLKQKQLKKIRFPLADYTKEQIREIASKNNLPSASASDSQEICFIPDNDYKKFIHENSMGRKPEPGDIVGMDGTFFKKHEGIYRYTIGQRRGLGISYSEPLYVVDIDPVHNKIIVGTKEHLNKKGLIVENITLQKTENLHGLNVFTKIRSTHEAKASTIEIIEDGTLRVIFHSPITQVSPGQAAVFYDENKDVLGGGWIKQSIPL